MHKKPTMLIHTRGKLKGKNYLAYKCYFIYYPLQLCQDAIRACITAHREKRKREQTHPNLDRIQLMI